MRIRDSEYLNYELLDEKVTEGWLRSSRKYNKIVPINFRSRGKLMLSKLMEILSKRAINIHPDMNKLIVSLRTATSTKEA
jgi:hypothetical protein